MSTVTDSTASVAHHMKQMVQSAMKADMEKQDKRMSEQSNKLVMFQEDMTSMRKQLEAYKALIDQMNFDINGLKGAMTPISGSPHQTPDRTVQKEKSFVPKLNRGKVAKTIVLDSDDESEPQVPEIDYLKVSITPNNPAEPIGFKFEEYQMNGKKVILFKGTVDSFDKKSASDNFKKLNRHFYVVRVGDVKVDNMPLEEFIALVRSKNTLAIDFYFDEMTTAQKRTYKKVEEDNLKSRREYLWKLYQLFFSDQYREENRSKYRRYRPESRTCGAQKAIDMLLPLVTKRHKKLCEATDKILTEKEMYQMLDKMDEDEWQAVIDKVEKPRQHALVSTTLETLPIQEAGNKRKQTDDELIMSFKDPREKKSKTLKGEFVAKGKGTAETYDKLAEKFDQATIRVMFGL